MQSEEEKKKDSLNWVRFLFPKVHWFNRDGNENLSECIKEYEQFIDWMNTVAKCNPRLGEIIKREFNKLCDEVFMLCLVFVDDSDKLLLFESKDDATNVVDFFYYDIIVGCLRVFKDNFDQLFQKWASNVGAPKQVPAISNEESASKKKKKTRMSRPNIPKEARRILSEWFANNLSNPYPKLIDKERLSAKTGLSIKKIDNWFINERSRKWHLYNRPVMVV